MRVKLQAANGCQIVIRTDAQRESAAYREAVKRAHRDYPGEGWLVVGIAF